MSFGVRINFHKNTLKFSNLFSFISQLIFSLFHGYFDHETFGQDHFFLFSICPIFVRIKLHQNFFALKVVAVVAVAVAESIPNAFFMELFCFPIKSKKNNLNDFFYLSNLFCATNNARSGMNTFF